MPDNWLASKPMMRLAAHIERLARMRSPSEITVQYNSAAKWVMFWETLPDDKRGVTLKLDDMGAVVLYPGNMPAPSEYSPAQQRQAIDEFLSSLPQRGRGQPVAWAQVVQRGDIPDTAPEHSVVALDLGVFFETLAAVDDVREPTLAKAREAAPHSGRPRGRPRLREWIETLSAAIKGGPGNEVAPAAELFGASWKISAHAGQAGMDMGNVQTTATCLFIGGRGVQIDFKARGDYRITRWQGGGAKEQNVYQTSDGAISAWREALGVPHDVAYSDKRFSFSRLLGEDWQAGENRLAMMRAAADLVAGVTKNDGEPRFTWALERIGDRVVGYVRDMELSADQPAAFRLDTEGLRIFGPGIDAEKQVPGRTVTVEDGQTYVQYANPAPPEALADWCDVAEAVKAQQVSAQREETPTVEAQPPAVADTPGAHLGASGADMAD